MRRDIRNIILNALVSLYPEQRDINFSVNETDPKFGDYSTNIAMVLARKTGEKPEEVALKFKELLLNQNIFESIDLAGPGFINLKINISNYQRKVEEIIQSNDGYGSSDLGKDLKINVEFISANPTGPLTLGNGRGGYFGDCLSRVLEKYGATVEREYYINDRGGQIIALGHSILKDSQAIYRGAYIDEIAPQIKSKQPEKAGEEAATILMEEYIKKTIEKMGIRFDKWFSEKSLHQSESVAQALGELEKLGLIYKNEDALWLRTTQFGDDKDRVIVTKDGEYTYFASDIAYHFDKMKRGYNLLFDFWGADHHGYIGRLAAAIDMMRAGIDWGGELKVMIAQLVRLMSNGQEVKMSKRAGTYVTLDELIEEVGPDVTRFFFLDRALDTHMDFDLELAKDHSDKNPVYYVQYAYARINSIIAKAAEPGESADLSLLSHPMEIALIKQLVRLPELVEEIAGDYQIQKLTFYARDLATTFHHFYEQCSVINSGDNKLTTARLALLEATKIVLKNTLDLIGVSAPEKM